MTEMPISKIHIEFIYTCPCSKKTKCHDIAFNLRSQFENTENTQTVRSVNGYNFYNSFVIVVNEMW